MIWSSILEKYLTLGYIHKKMYYYLLMILIPANKVEKIKYFSTLLGLIFIEITRGPLHKQVCLKNWIIIVYENKLFCHNIKCVKLRVNRTPSIEGQGFRLRNKIFILKNQRHPWVQDTMQKLNEVILNIQGESEKSITFWVIFNEKSVLYFGKLTTGKYVQFNQLS